MYETRPFSIERYMYIFIWDLDDFTPLSAVIVKIG